MSSSSIHAVPDDNEPIDPLNLEDLRYEEAEYSHGDVASKKVISAIQVRKPANNKEWFRLHPSQDYQLPTALYLRENEELIRPETYLVLPKYRDLFGSKGLTPVRLRLAVNSLDTVFIWDMRVPSDGRMTAYYASLQDAADDAEGSWVKLEYNYGARAYDRHFAMGDLGDPQFDPDGANRTMLDWIRLGFKGLIIDSEDHPVVAEYQGRRL